MNSFAKTIKTFLIDGDPNGRLSCELSNWSCKAYKIPRIHLKESKNREDIKGTGIYILFGSDDEGVETAYIGESEEVFNRLTKHLSEKEFWTEAIIFISKDENLNKAHIKFIEHELYTIAKDVNRYKLTNANTPKRSSISESDQAEMVEFIYNIKLLTNSLGFKIFENLGNASSETKMENEQFFYIKGVRGAEAVGKMTSEGFVVLKDSLIANEVVESFSDNLAKHRNKLLEKSNGFSLSENVLFSSPSMAASIIMGRSANGLTNWKLKNGKSIKELEEE